MFTPLSLSGLEMDVQRVCASEARLEQEKFLVGEKSKSSNSTEIVTAVQKDYVFEEKDKQVKNAVSKACRSFGKRKLKFWYNVITACGFECSHQFKKTCQGFPHLPCFNTRKLKRCMGHGDNQEKCGSKIRSLDHAEASKKFVHTKDIPEKMELTDVLVKQDELAAKLEFTSSSKIECDVEGGTATKASKQSHADSSKLRKYSFKKKSKKKSMIFSKKGKEKAHGFS